MALFLPILILVLFCGLCYVLYIAYEARLWAQQGVIAVEIFSPSGDASAYRVKIKDTLPTGKAKSALDKGVFTINAMDYVVNTSPDYARRVRRASGFVTVIKLYYLENVANPINFKAMKLGDTVTGEQLHYARTNHLASDALKAAQEVLSPVVILVLTLVGVAIIGFFVQHSLSGQINKVANDVHVLAQPPVEATVGVKK